MLDPYKNLKIVFAILNKNILFFNLSKSYLNK